MTADPADPKDFFISYNHHDEAWATWIAWALEEAGYTTVIQAWDFRPGTNFAIQMDEAVRNSKRTIAVVSQDFMSSTFTAPEWAAAFAKDPTGGAAKLVPVRVRPCEVEGLLEQVVRIDLVGQDDIAAKETLLAGLEVGRAKPLTPPTFPGAAAPMRTGTSGASTSAASRVASRGVDWSPYDRAEIEWFRVADRRYSAAGAAVLELQLFPTMPARVEVRRLAALKDEMIRVARGSGLVTTEVGLSSESNGELVHVTVTPSQESDAGLVVRRDGQRGGWFQLPHDSMGSVLDERDVTPRLAALLRVLTSLDVDRPERVAIGVRLGPATRLVIGSADVVGRRSTASFGFATSENVTLTPDDSVDFAALASNTDAVAEEIVARLVAQFSLTR